MYCHYFGFREKPFNITPNPRFIYLSKQHKEAFAHLVYGIKNHAGFIELTGEVGTGKTTVLRTILEQLDDEKHRTALILNPCLSSTELLRNINREFAIPHEGLENGALLDELNIFLLAENRAGRTIVLVIDEAQNLDAQVLEQIRLISNLETESDKLIQIVLAGQPELNGLLATPELRQLAQRVTVKFHLMPMDFEDSCAYIRHRLQIAGAGDWITFPPDALKKIFRFSKGSPRLLNIACDRALLVAYGEETQLIDKSIVIKALEELKEVNPPVWRPSLRQTLSAAAILGIAAMTLFVLLSPRKPALLKAEPSPQPVPVKSAISKAPENKTAPVAPQKQAPPAAAATIAAPPAKPSKAPPAAAPASPLARLPAGPEAAFNAVAGLWQAPYAYSSGGRTSLKEMAAKAGLTLTPLNATFATLQQFNLPTILELQLPDTGTRYLALIGAERDQLVTTPPLPDGHRPTLAELGKSWKGRAYILWRNYQNIPVKLHNDAAGAEVIRLQILLAEAGFLTSELSGTYDEATRNAQKAFQKARGIKADGNLNDLTLLLLYRDGGRFATPKLSRNSAKRSAP